MGNGEKNLFLAFSSVRKGLLVGGISKVLGMVRKKIKMDFKKNLIGLELFCVIFWVHVLSAGQAGGADAARQL